MSHVAEGVTARGALTRWFLGVLVGGIVGVAPLALGTLGLVLSFPVIIWAAIDRPRGVALGGALIGIGAALFVVWGRVIQSCAGPNTATDGCIGPDLGGLLAGPIALLALGGLISFVAAMRLSRSQPPREGQPTSGRKH